MLPVFVSFSSLIKPSPLRLIYPIWCFQGRAGLKNGMKANPMSHPLLGMTPLAFSPPLTPICDNSTLCTMVRITARLECALQPHSTSKPAFLPIHTTQFKAPFVTQLAKFTLLHLLTFTSRGSLSGNCLKWPLKQDFWILQEKFPIRVPCLLMHSLREIIF